MKIRKKVKSQTIKVSTLRTEDNLKVRLAMIADRISRAAILSLVRVGPALIQRAIPREASLARTLAGALSIRDRINAHANVLVAARKHQAQVVSAPLEAVVLAVAELEQGLGRPLASSAPLGVAGETHAEVFVGSDDGAHFLGGDVDGLGALEHVEAAVDLVEGELLGPGAVVPDVDVERGLGVALEKGVVNWSRCGHQGEQRGEK
jgi:hypothetical protein